MAMTTVQLRTETKEKLNALKIHPRETYDELIDRLADAAYDDEPLSSGEIEDLRTSENDIKAGRVRSLRDIMRDLGDDQVIRSLR
jgi:PHD/YefM family antitoxin component YafN of YafNO toxin-antitoxin module